MSYQEQSDLYRDLSQRNRMEMCVREQAIMTFSGSPVFEVDALARGVAAGNLLDVDAVIAAACVHQNWAQILAGDDAALTGAVQESWPVVAAARYPAP